MILPFSSQTGAPIEFFRSGVHILTRYLVLGRGCEDAVRMNSIAKTANRIVLLTASASVDLNPGRAVAETQLVQGIIVIEHAFRIADSR